MSVIDWLIMIVPIVIILGFGIYARKYVRGVADFLAAGRVAGRYVISVGDLQAGLGVVTLVAMVEQNYQCGFAMSFWNSVTIPLGIVFGLTGFCNYRFRSTRCLSFGQFLEMRYSRPFRIFAAALRTISEMLINAIGPAVAARFFIYFLGLPNYVHVFGMTIPSFMILLLVVLGLAMTAIWPAGRISLIITDCFQGLMSYPIFVIFTVFVLCNISWVNEIAPVMLDRAPQESFLDPMDIAKLRDFNIFALIVTIFGSILNRASWYGNDTTGCGRTPHEQKMAGIIGNWRNGFSAIMCTLVGASVITIMTHQNFADKSHEIRVGLANKIAEEVVEDTTIRKEFITRIKALPTQTHTIGVDEPYSRDSNPDVPYLNTARASFQAETDGSGQAVFQKFRTLYYQMMLPTTMRSIFPPVMMGLFGLLMIMLMISTDDSRIFNASSTIVQDVIMPLRKKPMETKEHLLYLRLTSVAVCVFFFFVSVFMAQLDYINMFSVIMCSLWLGGAGPVMIFGLYSRFGTTGGAWASVLTGSGVSLAGIIGQRNWADIIYPWLEAHNYRDTVAQLFENLSSPFHPFIVWEMDPAKFPINSQEIYFAAMVCGLAAYIIGSIVTYRQPYNLDRLLHRGKYRDEEQMDIRTEWSWKTFMNKLVTITPEYTRGDKIIVWSVFGYSIVYQFLIMFVGVAIWNIISPWPVHWWATYFLITNLIVVGIVGVVSTVWFMWGGIVDMRKMFRDLASRVDNPLDDGRVEGNVSLADKAIMDKIDDQNNAKKEK